MFDIAWTEMLVIAVVAVIVVGPRDLPKVMKAVGQMMSKARSMAGKFQSDMDALARETELEDLRKKARAYQATMKDPKRELTRLIDPTTGEEVKAGPKISDLKVGGDGGPRPYRGNTAKTDAPQDAGSQNTQSEDTPSPINESPNDGSSNGQSHKDGSQAALAAAEPMAAPLIDAPVRADEVSRG
ncbi:Sec-independent protein translocase protein TatB [Iodidimonas nitroreducens]|uniref:Sec-independent protein translocase protein TatB n=1 Tax=Iodidimonas nitroreducens TaxID=1236968 RepID=A0A5A7N4M4_9PROT|nr:Sec-independent protein translocase protein TatB [Iodidimonas nitroreducens]GAK32421.1 sec-independent protein translocase protein TatB [alpha proteobacterium Q-1]GER03222.1 Sec-independent protein translocase protein TatB [Iodidimonas nitroreducens]